MQPALGVIHVFRCVLGLVCGYAVMVLLITLVQETWFGGVGYGSSPIGELLIAGALTAFSAVIGGLVCAWVSGRLWIFSTVLMCGAVVAETTYLLLSGRTGGPLWFELLAAGSLIVGILVGAFFAAVWLRASPGQIPKKLVSQP